MVLGFIGAFKNSVHDIATRMNGFAEFAVVPRAASMDLLRQLGVSSEGLECGFCHEKLLDLSRLRALYPINGRLIASCDKFECAILARDQLLD